MDKFGNPDVIWASPDCTTFSIAAISHHRRKNPETGNLDPISDYAKLCDNVDQHVINLIKELNPTYYFIENPRGGMRKMSWMQDLPRYTVTYCQYNDPLVQELIFKMKQKKCPKCGKIKDIGEFYSNKSKRDGFSVYCKECIKNDSHDYYKKNKEECRERLNNWRNKNREYVRERDKKYREENLDYFYNKARERKLAQKKVSDGTVTLEYEQYLYDEQNGKCAYCGCNLNESGKHLDHIVPLSKGGLHTANNVHWTCPTCNLSKGDKLEDEWLKKERMKPSDIWTNHPNPKFLPMCKNGDPCHESAPRGSKTGTQGLKDSKERSKIPTKLCEHIVDICEEYIK